MTDQERDEVEALLRDGAAKVEAALAVLDTSSHPCPDCGNKLFDHYDEMRVRERLDAVPERLRVAASRLRNSESMPQICMCKGGRQLAQMKSRGTRQLERMGHLEEVAQKAESDASSIDRARLSESKKRAAPWEGRGRKD